MEDKLRTEYEPYIFAALNSAKVMLVVGTDYENFDAVWVKNEWSRFLKLIAKGEKKTLIPVFKNMDAYDMPKEFAKLAAQDMGKVGAMQDLIRGVEKIVGKKKPETVKETVVVQQGGGPNVTALLDRGKMALEDEDWGKASELFDQVLNVDSRNAEAYLGMTMAEEKCGSKELLAKVYINTKSNCKNNRKLLRARQFGNLEMTKWFEDLDRQAEELDRQEKEVVELSRTADMHLDRREYCEALELYRIAAESGYAHAQFEMGVFYQDGLGGLPKGSCS